MSNPNWDLIMPLQTSSKFPPMAELLEVIAQAEGVTLNQVIAVGDGANDLWMLNKAGLGIAFNAKPRVQEKAGARINQKSLKYVLTLLGYSDQDMEELSNDY
ncbi:hypothetical protein G6F35_007558 [Rhizopus arrhizus]|nr:hypothetical protein G6F35_007558 [Rhizopus arrhizus]